MSGFPAWRSGFALPEKKQPAPFNAPFNSLQVYGATYRLVVEVTETASRIELNAKDHSQYDRKDKEKLKKFRPVHRKMQGIVTTPNLRY